MKANTIKLISFFLLFLQINCSQGIEPNDDNRLIALLQTGAQFSSDGQKIVFEGLYDSIYAVHFIDISGNYLGYILKDYGFLSSPTWSPDNKKIAVSINGNLYTVTTNGDSLTKLTNNGEDFFCNWSPDGRYIAYTKTICDPECGIMLYDFSNGTVSLKTKYGSYASWSSDSKRVYYRTNLNQNSSYMGFVFRRIGIDILQKDSLFYVKSADGGLQLVDCTISPDEKEILFAASYGSPARMNIWKIILQTKEMFQITYDGGNNPSYNPAGDKIVYTNTNFNEGGLWIMSEDGSNKQRLTKLNR
ncbi:MAG: hypothetical protein WCT99_05500 [Bacteroidota bacterium]|jgi:Tol biopolymer transport system component